MPALDRLPLCLRSWGLCAAALAAIGGCSRSEAPQPAAPQTTSIAQEAQRHVDAAEELLAAGRREEAIAEYTRALALVREGGPRSFEATLDADVLLQRGLVYLEIDFPDTAAADFSDALRLRPDWAEAYAGRGQAYVRMGDLYKGVRDCTEAIRLDPRQAMAYRYRGEGYLLRTQYDRAVVDLRQALALDPGLSDVPPRLAWALHQWGQTLADAGDDQAAAVAWRQAHELDPALPLTGPAPAAAPLLGSVEQTVAKPVVDNAAPLIEAGQALIAGGDLQGAVRELTAAIALRGDAGEAYFARGQALLGLGFPDTAVKDFEAAVRHGERAVDVYRSLAQAYLQLGAGHRAVLAATEALHAEPLEADAYALRGEGYLSLGQWERAIADLEYAVRLQPALGSPLRDLLERAYRLRELARTRAESAADPRPGA